MTFLTLVPPLQENVVQYGADPTGATDSTNAILAAYSAASGTRGAGIGFPPGLFIVSAPLVPYSNNYTKGAGAGSTIIQYSSFTGAAVFNLNNVSFCDIRDLTVQGASGTYSSNPACDAIDITGCTDVIIERCYFNYINGWAINSTSSSSVGNTHITFQNVYTHLCGAGIQILGNPGSGGVGSHKLINTVISGTQNGDCYLIQDIHDILGSHMYGEVSAGSGVTLHLKGSVAAVDISVFDIGPYPGPSTGPVIEINGGVNGNPKNINLSNGTIEGGSVGIQINAGTWLTIDNCKIFNNNTAGVNIADPAECRIVNCMFDQNGSVAGSGRYDIVNASNQMVEVQNNKFMTPQGNTAGHVNTAINDTGAQGYYDGNFHDGLNGSWNATNVYASGGTPHVYQNMLGVTAQGMITPPTLTGSPFTMFGVAYPRTIYISGGTVSDVSIGGTTTGRTSGAFPLPPRVSLTITYSAAPTVAVETMST